MSFEINDMDDLRKLIIMAQGGNPDAQQTLNDFLQFKNPIERSNLPTRKDVQLMVFLDFAGKTFYPDQEQNPFSTAADTVAIAFMAKGGEKSKQFVELMKQTPSLADLQSVGEENKGILNRFLGGKKSE